MRSSARGESLLHQLGNEGDRHEDAPLAGIFAEHRAVAGIDAGGDGRRIILQRLHAGQIAHQGDDPEGAKANDHHDQRGGGQAKPFQKTAEQNLGMDEQRISARSAAAYRPSWVEKGLCG